MYDTGFVAVPGGLAGLQAAISDTYFPIDLERATRTDDVQGAIATASMGALRWASIRVSGPFYTRRRMRTPADARRNHVLMLLLEGGQVELEDKRTVVMGPGELILLDANRPLESEQRSAGTTISISFPAPLLKSRFLEVDDWCMMPLDTSQGPAAILRECMLSCWRSRASLGSTSANDLCSSLVHLLAAAFRNSPESPVFDSRSAGMHFLRVRELVAANLDNPELSVDFVAERLHISKSYLFSIMNAADSTLGRYILERRLDRSREMLSDPALKHHSIGDIAFAVGFQELSHFSRRFSERFGKSPRAFRAAACRTAEMSSGSARVIGAGVQ
jgi:AraC family transcriptional regulator, positive regulator of tynA and feaB